MQHYSLKLRRQIYYASNAIDADEEYLAPEGLSYLPFQKAGIKALLLPGDKLLADPPGLGKTIQTIGFINNAVIEFKNILIICPASLCTNWKRELQKWLVDEKTIKIISKKSERFNRAVDIHIASFNMASAPRVYSFFNRYHQPDLLIVDESHFLKNRSAKRTAALIGRKIGLHHHTKKNIFLSGTPIVNRPIEIFSTIEALCHQAVNNMGYVSFGFKYCNGYKEDDGFNFNGSSNEKELGIKLRSYFMIRRNKAEVLKDLPEKSVSMVWFPHKASSQEKDYISEFSTNGFPPGFDLVVSKFKEDTEDENPLATMRRETGEKKADQVADYIKTLLATRQKIVVFAYHKNVIDILQEKLANFNPVVVKGSVSQKKRQSAIDSFQNEIGTRIFLGSIGSAGVGLTLTSSYTVVFAEFSWVPGENEQAIDRCHRIGQDKSVEVKFCMFENSLDELILRTHLRKAKTIERVMLDE